MFNLAKLIQCRLLYIYNSSISLINIFEKKKFAFPFLQEMFIEAHVLHHYLFKCTHIKSNFQKKNLKCHCLKSKSLKLFPTLKVFRANILKYNHMRAPKI